MQGVMKKERVLSIFVAAALIFTMLVCSIPAVAASAMLSDIEGHWAQGAIREMVGEGFISGYPDGTFKPNANITRAEFATLAVRIFALEPGPGKVFNDTAGHWAKDAISTASHHGLVSGYSDSLFGPNDFVTREQIAAIIVSATKANSTGEVKTFTDSNKVAAWAKEAVEKAAAAGLITGYPDGTFRPQAHATRAEAAVLLARCMEPVEKEALVTIYDSAATYGPRSGTVTIDGDAVISAAGVILRNTIIKGNLIISPEVGDGDVTLNNVTVQGTTFIRGGGKDSIHINGGQYGHVIIESTPGGKIRLVAINVEGLQVIISEKAAGEEIILEGIFKSVEIKADNVVLSTQGKTAVGELKVAGGVTGTTINIKEGTTVKELVLDSVTKVDNAKDTVEKISGDEKTASWVANPPQPPPAGGGGGSGGAPSTDTVFASLDKKIENIIEQLNDKFNLDPGLTGISGVTYVGKKATFLIADPEKGILAIAGSGVIDLFQSIFSAATNAKIIVNEEVGTIRGLATMEPGALKGEILEKLIMPLLETDLTLGELIGKKATIELTIEQGGKTYTKTYTVEFEGASS